MPKYIQVVCEGPHDSETVYVKLEDGEEMDEELIESMAQDAFFNLFNYGFSVVDEGEVPERDRS